MLYSFFFVLDGGQQELTRVDRRQGQVCIRDRYGLEVNAGLAGDWLLEIGDHIVFKRE